MNVHKLGGGWTEQKLDCVKMYAHVWALIMQRVKQKNYIDSFVYIDAFSGSGSYQENSAELPQDDFFSTKEDSERLKSGSATNAINIEPRFDEIHLIEKNPDFVEQLEVLVKDQAARNVIIHKEDANSALKRIVSKLSRRQRALVFIDPYGCEVDFKTLKALGQSGICDVWYLAPTAGINRQLKGSPNAIEGYKVDRLNKILGTSEWVDEFYTEDIQSDLFGDFETISRNAGPEAVESFLKRQLRSVFAYVNEDCLQLRNSKNGHMFSLIFCMANKSATAQKHGARISSDVFKKLK